MSKRTTIFLAAIGILGLVFCGMSHASTVTVNLESQGGVQPV
jgi:hypothetical protein